MGAGISSRGGILFQNLFGVIVTSDFNGAVYMQFYVCTRLSNFILKKKLLSLEVLENTFPSKRDNELVNFGCWW